MNGWNEPSGDACAWARVSAWVCAALLLFTGCSAGGPREDRAGRTPSAAGPTATSASPSGAPDAAGEETPVAAEPPRPDGCYLLDRAGLTRPTDQSRPVGCRGRHNAQTIHVGELDLVIDGHAIAVDSRRARQQVSRTCPRKFAEYVGGSEEQRDLSRLRVVWFGPTLEEADAGARWFRCDLVVFGHDDELHERAGRIPRGVLAGDDALDRFGLCGTAEPGTPAFRRVLCDLPHAWRAIATIELPGTEAYPGREAVRQGGDSACQDRVREEQGFPLTFTYGWEWPTRDQWRSGQRFGYCWAEA